MIKNCRNILLATVVGTAGLTAGCASAPSAYDYYLYGDKNMNSGYYASAIRYFDMAIQLEPDSEFYWYNRAEAKYKLGKYEEAIKDYDQAIKLDPDYVYAYNGRGISKQKLSQYAEAIKDHDQAIQLKPDYAPAYYQRGYAKGKLGQYAEAIKDYGQAIKLAPDDAWPYFNRGYAKGELGQYAEAIKDYDQAIRLNPDFAFAYNNRGANKAKLNEYEEALKDYDKAVKLDPDYALASKNREFALSRYLEEMAAKVDSEIEVMSYGLLRRAGDEPANDYENLRFSKTELETSAGWMLLSGPTSGPVRWQKAKDIFDKSARSFLEGQLSYYRDKKQQIENQRWQDIRRQQEEKPGIGTVLIGGIIGGILGDQKGGDRAVLDGIQKGLEAGRTYVERVNAEIDKQIEFTKVIYDAELKHIENISNTKKFESHDVRFAILPFRTKWTSNMVLHGHSFPVGQPFTNAIGKLIFPGGRCTAFLISQGLAMTNHHCVINDDSGEVVLPNSVNVSLTGIHGERKEFSVNKIITPPKITTPGKKSRCHNDWAILHLEEKAGEFTHAYLETSITHQPLSPSNAMYIATAGFPSDLYAGGMMTVHWGCRVKVYDERGLMQYSCHNAPGASGSPLIDVTPGSENWGKLVGINACGVGPGSTRVSIGTSLSHIRHLNKDLFDSLESLKLPDRYRTFSADSYN